MCISTHAWAGADEPPFASHYFALRRFAERLTNVAPIHLETNLLVSGPLRLRSPQVSTINSDA